VPSAAAPAPARFLHLQPRAITAAWIRPSNHRSSSSSSSRFSPAPQIIGARSFSAHGGYNEGRVGTLPWNKVRQIDKRQIEVCSPSSDQFCSLHAPEAHSMLQCTRDVDASRCIAL